MSHTALRSFSWMYSFASPAFPFLRAARYMPEMRSLERPSSLSTVTYLSPILWTYTSGVMYCGSSPEYARPGFGSRRLMTFTAFTTSSMVILRSFAIAA